jgi:hypothetical protein
MVIIVITIVAFAINPVLGVVWLLAQLLGSFYDPMEDDK